MVEAGRRGALAGAGAVLTGPAAASSVPATAWLFRLPLLDGGELNLADHARRPMLVVNTASLCGYTPQYAGLQRLHERYGPRGLLVLGTPSGDFQQEHADRARVRQFCDAQFGITFPLTGILHVRGPQQHPFWRWLTMAAGTVPQWNFHKFLVGTDGRTVQAFPTATEPEAPALLRMVEAALA